jgi:lysozyme family protein
VNFDQAFDRLISNEGGYCNVSGDPGGETKFGISKRSYPNVDIAGLTREQAKEIYRRDFWLRGQMDQYDGAIAFQAFDAAVNHGIETSIRLLQRSAGVADDGHVGPITIAAIKGKSVTDMLMLFIAQRIKFWTRLSTWSSFGKGWANRAADDLIYAAEDA